MENEEREVIQVTHPDEDSGVLIDEFIKIHDPESGEIFFEGRV